MSLLDFGAVDLTRTPMLFLRVFGYPALMAKDGTEERFRTRKHLGLLVYLVLEARARPVTRDQVIELLWPAVPPERGGHSLSQALSVIRSTLGRDAIAARGPGIQLVATVPTEVELLSAGGPLPENLDQPLAGFEHMAGAEFSHWLDATREQLTRILATALLDDLDAGRRAGDVPRVHEVARKLYRIDPYSEPAVQALCEQHLNDGDAPAAAKLIRRHLDRLEAEVGIAGSPGLHRLLQQVETGHLAMRRVDRTAPRASRHRRPEAFVGRDAEVSRLEALWTRTRAGRRQTCLVTGPAGIGKTSLLGRFATSVASRAAAAVEVTCQEIGRDIPFAALSDLILALVQYPAASGTDARWLAEASRIAPTLPEIYTGLPEPPPLTGESIRLRLAEAVGRILDAVSEEGPMLLVLDDIMYLDPASRDILHRLLQRHESSPLFVLASARTPEEPARGRGATDTETGIRWDDVIPLDALTEGQVHEMLRRLLGSSAPFPGDLAAGVAELGEGNPYLIEMLLSDWQRRGTGSLVAAHLHGEGEPLAIPISSMMHRAFERQYADLAPEAERMLSLLAVVGRRLSAQEITQLLAFAPSLTDSAALQLLDRGILRIEAGSLCFKNQLHRSYVYRNTAEGIRAFLHMKLGSFLEQVGHAEFKTLLESARHHYLGGNPERGVDVLILGAETSLGRGAPREAARALEQMIAAEPKYRNTEMRVLLAESHLAQGHHSGAIREIGSLKSDDLRAQDQARASVITAEAHFRGQLCGTRRLLQLADEALERSAAVGSETLITRSLQLNAEAAHDTCDASTIQRVRVSAEAIIKTTRDEHVRATARITAGYCTMVSGSHQEAATHFAAGCGSLRELGRDHELRRALNGLGICLTNLGKMSEAQSHLQEALQLARQAADPFSQSIIWDNLAVIYEDVGQLAKAVMACKKAFECAYVSPTEKRRVELLTNAASLAITIQSFEEASHYLAEAVSAARTLPIPGILITALVAKADLAIAQRQYSQAWNWAEEAQAVASRDQRDWRPIGDFRRVQLHYTWATKGYEAFRLERDLEDNVGLSFRRTQRLELQALCDWIDQQEGRKGDHSRVPEDMLTLGLYGSILRLAVLGILPDGLVDGSGGPVTASTVKAIFPDDLTRDAWPERVGVPR